MNAIDIKCELMRAGVTQAQIAKEAGVTRQMVYLVINGQVRSMNVAGEISKAIGKPVEQIFEPK